MAVTLQDLIDQTRFRSNMEENNFVTDAELTIYINNSLAEMDDVLVTTYNDYNLNTFQAVLTDTNNIISIPSNFYKLRGVDFQDPSASTNQWVTLRPFQLVERNRGTSTIGRAIDPWGRTKVSYLLTNAGITITPATSAAGTYQVFYVPKFNPLVLTTDTLTIQMDTQAWIEYVVVDCCAKINNKQNMDPSGFLAEKAALKQRIISAARNRNAGSPKGMVNVRYNDDSYFTPGDWDMW